MTSEVLRLIRDEKPKSEVQREWLVTNGLGGFASATVSGEIARRYHGFLIAALPAPLGRVVLLNDLDCEIERADGSMANIRDAGIFPGSTLSLGLPSWRWEIDGLTLERSVLMPARHNTVHITFRLIGAARGVRLRLRPFISFRRIEAAVDKPLADSYRLIVQGQRYEVYQGPDLPTLRMMMRGCDGRPSPPMAESGASACTGPRPRAATRRAAMCGARAISRPSCCRTAR